MGQPLLTNTLPSEGKMLENRRLESFSNYYLFQTRNCKIFILDTNVVCFLIIILYIIWYMILFSMSKNFSSLI